MTITNYSSTANDRFSSGFPTNPVENSNASFIGSGLDWSGIGWSTTTHAASSYKGFAMLSPKHFLAARHYEIPSLRTQGIRVEATDGTTYTTNGVDAVDYLGYGILLTAADGSTDYDIAVGKLASSPSAPDEFARIAVLDLHSTSTANDFNAYAGNVLLYGRGGSTNSSPRTAQTAITAAGYNGGDTLQPILVTAQTDATFVEGDSGAPALRIWTNPNGDEQLTLLGVNSAVGEDANFISFLALPTVINAAQSGMNGSGHSLQINGEPNNTWRGQSSTRITRSSAWSSSSATRTDRYVLFDANSAFNRNVNVNGDTTFRGIYFKNTATVNDSFSFSGNSTLSIGRGGITNYDADNQTLTADLALVSPQFWDAGTGGLSLNNIDTNGHLLEIRSSGNSSITGTISEGGSLALESGSLSLTGNSTYTGATWIHGGTLHVSGDISSSSSITISRYGTLAGTGNAPSVSGAGTISPGISSGILTVTTIDPSNGLDFDFEFTAPSAPTYGTPSASVNDLLRITDTTPFSAALNAANKIRIFLNLESLSSGESFLGGFFTDQTSDFLSLLNNSDLEFYIADNNGSTSFGNQDYSLYNGPYKFVLTTVPAGADFGQGLVSGRIMQFTVEPDVSQYAGWKIFYNLSGNAALDSADDDGDGISLFLEFAFGGNPLSPNASILPSTELTTESGEDYLELSLTRPVDLQNLTYTPQTTTDLENWPNDSSGIQTPNPTPFDNGDGTETLTYRRTAPVSDQQKAFIRVKVSN